MKKLITLLAIILLFGCTKEELTPPTIEEGIYGTKVILWASHTYYEYVEVEFYGRQFMLDNWEGPIPYLDQEHEMPYFYVVENIPNGIYNVRKKEGVLGEWQEKGFTIIKGETLLLDVTNMQNWR